MVPFTSLTVFLILTAAGVKLVHLLSETGLIQLWQHPGSPYGCSQSLPVFVCTTSGLGETVLSLSKFNVDLLEGESLRVRHSIYTNELTTFPIRESHYHELITTVNISKSTDRECFDRVHNMTDFCYTTMFNVRLTDSTICSTIYCSTDFTNATHDIISVQFGSVIITTMPPAPANLRVMNQSTENITFTWDPVTKNCSHIRYHVLILNCGRCPPSTSTSDNTITCKDLVPGQNCQISLQTVQQCGFSEIVTMEVLIGGKQMSVPAIQFNMPNISTIAGWVIGFLVVLIFLLVLTLMIMIFLYIKTKQSQSKRNSGSHVHGHNTCSQQELQDTELQDIAMEKSDDGTMARKTEEKGAMAYTEEVECNGDTELQEMEDSLERVRTASISAVEKQREAAEKEEAAHNEAAKAREDVYELEFEKREIDKQLELHKEDTELKVTLESYLKRVCSILANAEKRKNEAVERENKAHEDKQKATEEAYNLHLRMDEKEGQVKIYKNKRASRLM